MMRALLVLLVACGPRTPRAGTDDIPWASAGVDWSKPPGVVDVPWRAPALDEVTLPNGIRIVVVENRRLPLVAVTALHRAAGSREDGLQAGRAALTVDLLATRDIKTTIATDHAAQEIVTLSVALPLAIDVLATSVRTRTLMPIDERKRARIAELQDQRAQTRRTAAQVFDRVVFGDHPYAQPAQGDATRIDDLLTADVRDFWARAYRPDALTLVFAGDVTLATARTIVEDHFGDWQKPAVSLPAVPPLPAYRPQLVYVDVPGAKEANVIIGRRAQAARDAKSLAGDVANAILGGGVDGRLDRELHGRLALTFGASASFWRGEAGGSWAAAATFATDRAGAGIRAMLAILEQARTVPPTDDELARARFDIMTAAQRSFETTHGAARATVRLVTSELPLDTFARLEARLAALTPTQVHDAIDLTDLSIVVVGDWSKLRNALGTVGLPATPYQP